MGKRDKEEIKPIEEEKPIDKSILSSEEVEEAVQGDEEALAEQMERIKNLTKEQQIAAIEEMKRKAAEKILNDAKAKKEAEEKAKQDAELAAKKQLEDEARKVAEQKIAEQKALADKLAAEEKAKQDVIAKQEAERQALAEQKKTREENQKQQEIERQKTEQKKQKGGPSTFKRILAIMLFLAFGAIIYFLPEITKFINDYKASKTPKPVITTGTSICTLSKSNENLDINITASFSIINSKLYKLTYITATKGDKVDDKESLDKLNQECLKLKEEAGELEGVTIACSLNNGINSNKQILDYEKLDATKVTSAYVEAGGVYPEFQKNENIDKIESKMTKAGYNCNRN